MISRSPRTGRAQAGVWHELAAQAAGERRPLSAEIRRRDAGGAVRGRAIVRRYVQVDRGRGRESRFSRAASAMDTSMASRWHWMVMSARNPGFAKCSLPVDLCNGSITHLGCRMSDWRNEMEAWVLRACTDLGQRLRRMFAVSSNRNCIIYLSRAKLEYSRATYWVRFLACHGQRSKRSLLHMLNCSTEKMCTTGNKVQGSLDALCIAGVEKIRQAPAMRPLEHCGGE